MAVFVTGIHAALHGKSGFSTWILDSGANNHMTGELSTFTSPLTSIDQTVRIADGPSIPIHSQGDTHLSSNIILCSVYHVPNFAYNLLSVSCLAKNLNCAVVFLPNRCFLQDLTLKKIVGRGYERDGLYYFDVFEKFKQGDGNFMEALSNDAEGLLSLFEASHYGMHGETDLEDAKNFSSKHLKSLIAEMEIRSAEKIHQSLEFPLHWRMPRLETRNFIDFFDSDSTKNPLLLEFAKLDYNLVQSVHQKEVQELTKWWKNLGLKEKLSFSRDRLMENYLWAIGITSESQFSNCRIGLTKFACILSAIDDMYDIYGSIDELERFTDAVNRWSIKAADDLPEYMKLCYLAMFNFGNEISYDVLRDHDLNVVYYIKEQWANLCRSYLVEARWFYDRFIPTLDEYLENAWTSVGGPAAIAHAYLWVQSPITKTSLDSFKVGSQIIYWSSLITRLSNDLGTSKDEITRGDVAKSIQCYMKSEGAAEEHARSHIKGLISGSWRKLNEAITQKSHPKSIATLSLNMARTAQRIYQYGDGIGTSVGMTKDCLTSLIVDPIPIK